MAIQAGHINLENKIDYILMVNTLEDAGEGFIELHDPVSLWWEYDSITKTFLEPEYYPNQPLLDPDEKGIRYRVQLE